MEQTTKITHLLQMNVGEKRGGFSLFIKTYKKRWQQGKWWWQSCICMDDTGEILVHVKMDSNKNLGKEIRVVVGQIEETDWLGKPRKTLMVFEYSEPTQIADDYMAEQEKAFQGTIDEIRGKIRHGIVCSAIQSGRGFSCTDTDKTWVNKLVEFIITGE